LIGEQDWKRKNHSLVMLVIDFLRIDSQLVSRK